ncbi:MAG TPA: hypothetical protein VF615_11850 [Longimicrobiaceae bacterium]|jgi:hypothetical protein
MPKTRSETARESPPGRIPGPNGISKPPLPKTGSPSAVLEKLKRKRQERHDRARAYLLLDANGVCHINTGRMADRSQREVYNYAFLVNQYLRSQRGGRVKIKSTSSVRDAQGVFCNTVRTVNKDLFATLNDGKSKDDKLFSVVAHVPDECIQTRSFGESHNQLASTGTSGIGQAPGWLPMTRQANSLVANLGKQTLKSSGQTSGPYVSELRVDGEIPTCLLPVNALTLALGEDPFG